MLIPADTIFIFMKMYSKIEIIMAEVKALKVKLIQKEVIENKAMGGKASFLRRQKQSTCVEGKFIAAKDDVLL